MYRRSDEGVDINLVTGLASGGEANGDRLSGIEGVVGTNHDDVVTARNVNSLYFEGRGGEDTVKVSGSGEKIDLSRPELSDIEVIDLTGTGANRLALSAVDVQRATGALLDGKPILRIDGADGDSVIFGWGGVWTMLDSTRTIGGIEYSVFEHADATVLLSTKVDARIMPEGEFRINLTGTPGPDTMTGSIRGSKVYGLGGNDVLNGFAGFDHLDGGEGIDTASYSDSNEGVSVSLHDGSGSGGFAEGDTIVGIENLIGSAYDDDLTGNNGVNTLNGGAGNDILEGMDGADVLIGQGGENTASYRSSDEGVTVNLGLRTGSGGHAEGDTFANIHNLIGPITTMFLRATVVPIPSKAARATTFFLACSDPTSSMADREWTPLPIAIPRKKL